MNIHYNLETWDFRPQHISLKRCAFGKNGASKCGWRQSIVAPILDGDEKKHKTGCPDSQGMRVPQPLLLGILGMKLPENSLRVGPENTKADSEFVPTLQRGPIFFKGKDRKKPTIRPHHFFFRGKMFVFFGGSRC